MTADFKQGTNLLGKILASGQLANAAATTVYTVPTASAVKLASFSITNKSTSAVIVSAGIIPSGGAADGTHDVIYLYSLAAGDVISQEDVLSMLKGAMLDAGAQLVINPGTAAVLNYLVTGSVSS